MAPPLLSPAQGRNPRDPSPCARLTMAALGGLLFAAACVSSAPPKEPNDREWNALGKDYEWIETLRKAQPALPATGSRKQMIETSLENHRKIETVYVAFTDKLKEYYERTRDPRAAALMAREKVIMGDEDMSLLSRYDKA